jgi:hypothetical protein
LQNKTMMKWLSYNSPSVNPNLSLLKLISIRLRILFEWFARRILESDTRNKALKNMRDLRRSKFHSDAIVIANGPSFNIIDLDKLVAFQSNGLEIFVVNYFPITPGVERIVPNYLVLSDPATRIDQNSARTNLLWEWISNHPNVKIIVPTSWYKFLVESFPNKENFLFFDDTCLIGWSRNISPVRARSYLSLTAYKALAVACHFEYREISIIGFDNSQFRTVLVNETNRLIQPSSHFAPYMEDLDLSDILPGGVGDYFYEISSTFHDLKKFHHIKSIKNLDANSLVDAFPKEKNSKFHKSE